MRYNEKIKKYYKNNKYVGSFSEKSKLVGTGLAGSPACGDVMRLQIRVKNSIIINAKILVFGCVSAKASSTLGAEMLLGKTLEEALNIRNQDIINILELPKLKYHCSVLTQEAIYAAIEDYRNKNQNKTTKQISKNNKYWIDISAEAENFIQNILKQRKECNGIELILNENGGCGAWFKVKQVLKSNEKSSTNVKFTTMNGLNIFFNKNLWKMIEGIKIEYQEDELKKGIVFTDSQYLKNKNSCPCGKTKMV